MQRISVDYKSMNNSLLKLFELICEISYELKHIDEVAEELGIFWKSDAGWEYTLRLTSDMGNVRITAKAIAINIRTLYESLYKLDMAERKVLDEVNR